MGKVPAALILEWIPPDQPVAVPVDDTTPQHKGKRVYGKGRHHDAVRSTHSGAIHTVRRLCWATVLKESWKHAGVAKLPSRFRRTLLDHLSHAA